jgi:hypothetical protein
MTRAQRFHDAIHRGIATRLLLLTVGFLIAGASAALAYWTISTVYAPTSYAIAQANSLSAPSAPTATETGATAITVGWTLPATQLTGAQYKVTRNSGPGSGTVVCAVASNITSCQDMALSSATAYGYTVKAVIGTNWQSSPIAASATTIGVTTTSLTNGVVGSAYSGTLTAIGGTGTYTHWALSSGTLPSGATLNTSTGTISGTPNAAATTSGLQFTVTDSLGYTATSGSLSLTVSQASTTTSLSLSASSVVYGNEQTITFTSTVAPQFSGTATGTVAVKSGVTTLCTITLPATTCSTPATALTVSGSAYSVTAVYSGDTNFTTSTSTSQSLTVTKASTTTSLSLSASSVVYGNEQTVTFTSTVAPQFSGTATGTVAVKSGVTTLCTITLPASTCTTTSTALTVSGGAYSVTAVYSGDTNFTTSTSTGHNLTVSQASTTTSLSLSASSVVYGNEQTITFTSTVAPQFSGTATGTVAVKSGVTTLCTITLPASTCTTTSTALTVSGGAYSVTAVYSGDTNFTTSTSTSQSLTVTKASQIINFTSTAPTTASVGDTYTPTATASSGLTVALTIDSSSSSVCSISAGTVTYTTSGTCTIDANQSGGSNYNAAAQVQQAFNVSPGQLVITNGAVSGAASATPNLGPITVERRNAGGTPTAIGNLTVALASNSATKSFGTGQFGATVTTVTIPNGSSSVTFWYGDQTVGSPTVTASATGYGAGIQIETITTAPVGLGIVITGGTGTPALVCGPVASSYTCNITGVGSGGSATFYVTFWNGSKSQVVYSSTQSSTVFESGQNVGNVIIAATASSSNPSFLTASHTGATKTSTLTFGPYTLIISVNN